MAPTMLGKRRRCDDYDATALTSSKTPEFRPRKRQLRSSATNDENAPPILDASGRDDATFGDGFENEELQDPFVTSGSLSSQKSRSAQFCSVIGRIDGHFKSSKSITRESTEKTQLATPTTPRHRDALSKKIPITPRHRHLSGIPQTPRTPVTPSNASTIYNSARQLFVRSADPGRLVGRENERARLNSFINGGLASKSGRCMYISGPPGTGKSALVNEICGEYKEKDEVRTAYINCMSVKGPKDIHGKLMTELVGEREMQESDGLGNLKRMFCSKSASAEMYLVVLDEIDHLLTLDLEILYSLFEWSLTGSSRLILIGIANALDLTDRFLPRLKARNLKPELLPFLPYTVAQIGSVITSKLKSLLPTDAMDTGYVPYVHPTAIMFCSKKVATQTGDLRKAFDIIRRAIDLIDIETKQKHQKEAELQSLGDSPSKAPLGENINMSSPISPSKSVKLVQTRFTESLSKLTPETAPRVTIAHVARVTASAFNHGTAERLKSLNLQQKAALCSLIALEKKKLQTKRDLFSTPSKSANTAPTIRKVYEMYNSLCRRENALHPLTQTEFVDVMGNLETLSLVQGGDGKGVTSLGLARLTPSKKVLRAEDKGVVSCVSEKEIEACLEGPGGGILKRLLHGED